MSLLEELRQKAEIITGEHKKDLERLVRNAEQVDAALRRAFSFFLEAASYLNVITPENKRTYVVAGLGNLEGMRASGFFVDYRTTSIIDKPRLDHFYVRYKSSADRILEKQFDFIDAERVIRSLAQSHLEFEQGDLLNEKGKISRRSFRIPHLVRSELTFKGDYPGGFIRVASSNVEDFRREEFIHKAEDLDVSLLEDYVKLILGEANRVRQRGAHPTENGPS